MKKKVIRFFVVLALIIVAFVAQTTISKQNSSVIATPNLLLIVSCIFGFMRGHNYGTVVGFFAGILVDIMFGDVIGLYAFIYMFCGFFSGVFKKMFYSDHVFMPMLLIFTNDFIYNLCVYIFRFLLRNKQDFIFYLSKIIFPEMVITTFVVFLTYKLFYLLNEKVLSDKEESMISFDKWFFL